MRASIHRGMFDRRVAIYGIRNPLEAGDRFTIHRNKVVYWLEAFCRYFCRDHLTAGEENWGPVLLTGRGAVIGQFLSVRVEETERARRRRRRAGKSSFKIIILRFDFQRDARSFPWKLSLPSSVLYNINEIPEKRLHDRWPWIKLEFIRRPDNPFLLGEANFTVHAGENWSLRPPGSERIEISSLERYFFALWNPSSGSGSSNPSSCYIASIRNGNFKCDSKIFVPFGRTISTRIRLKNINTPSSAIVRC